MLPKSKRRWSIVKINEGTGNRSALLVVRYPCLGERRSIYSASSLQVISSIGKFLSWKSINAQRMTFNVQLSAVSLFFINEEQQVISQAENFLPRVSERTAWLRLCNRCNLDICINWSIRKINAFGTVAYRKFIMRKQMFPKHLFDVSSNGFTVSDADEFYMIFFRLSFTKMFCLCN